ncbi:transmembrane protein, putative [Bodo saltans]|nr:transmembrane protein, putative [Bodo saltans]|eukprot:CUE79976.1 transmembrane protein, putative [Bodo saltans]
MLCVVFVFASISFYYFSELYSPQVSGMDGFDCNTLLQCWLIHIDGIRSGGGVGDNAAAPSFHTGGQGYSFYVFRLMFFIIVVIIFLNIVFGIIVDSFAQLREDREFVEMDQVSKCFICGVEQNEFDRVAPGGFDHHIRTEHNMWHYLFFLHYIKKKDKANLSGQESHVWKKVKAKEPSFFPIGRAMMLQTELIEQDAEETKKLELYRGVMESIVSKYSIDVEMKIEGFGERLEGVEHAILGRSDLLGASTTSRRSLKMSGA